MRPSAIGGALAKGPAERQGGSLRHQTGRVSWFEPSERPESVQGSACAPREAQAEIRKFPYHTVIHRLIEDEQISAARRLLTVGLNQREVAPELMDLTLLLAPPKVAKSRYTGVDRDLELAWLACHGSSYPGEWVAVSRDRLLAHAPSLKALLAELKSVRIIHQPLIHWIDRE